MEEWTHFDATGRAKMVDVSRKESTHREAIARGVVFMRPETFKRITQREIKKGDVLGVAQIAGIMAAKKVSELIPLCHPLNLSSVEILFYPEEEKSKIEIEARVKVVGSTGVEMEALTAVSVAALTIYDMCKSYDREMAISEIRLMKKTGGKSGKFERSLD